MTYEPHITLNFPFTRADSDLYRHDGATSGDTAQLELFVPQTITEDVENRTTRVEIPYFDPKNNITLITGQENSFSISGILPYRLFDDYRHLTFINAYSQSKRGAAEWVQDVFSLLGSEMTMSVDANTDETFKCTISEFSVSVQFPEQNFVRWNMTVEIGRAFGDASPPRDADPKNISELGITNTTPIDGPVTFTITKSVSTSTTVVPDPDASNSAESNILLESGRARDINIDFEPFDAEDFTRQLRNKWDIDAQPFVLKTPFPGDEYEVHVDRITPSQETSSLTNIKLEVRQ